MAAIPNTMRRGAIYWFRRSRRLPDGKILRPTVSLRTARSSIARLRAAILSAQPRLHVASLLHGAAEINGESAENPRKKPP
ncbi:hypothetical protein [Sphingomonas xanthus]|uniref:Uncharacterized protein n=1 Tax=Sphingomonas xanthus TaxID=2594473 RepID=A0A516ITZ6_9SPHN|nr:hypothetical protein [Sphingomonas xanthus]QDP20369.1 hypothetical protein FMM02_10650 [Sphingomonas xanthus]